MFSCDHDQSPARHLTTSLWGHVEATSPIHWLTTAERTTPEEKYICQAAFSVAGPLAWNSLPDYTRDPAVGRDTFCNHLRTFLFAAYWYIYSCSALEILWQTRSTNPRFTYLLTLSSDNFTATEKEIQQSCIQIAHYWQYKFRCALVDLRVFNLSMWR